MREKVVAVKGEGTLGALDPRGYFHSLLEVEMIDLMIHNQVKKNGKEFAGKMKLCERCLRKGPGKDAH